MLKFIKCQQKHVKYIQITKRMKSIHYTKRQFSSTMFGKYLHRGNTALMKAHCMYNYKYLSKFHIRPFISPTRFVHKNKDDKNTNTNNTKNKMIKENIDDDDNVKITPIEKIKQLLQKYKEEDAENERILLRAIEEQNKINNDTNNNNNTTFISSDNNDDDIDEIYRLREEKEKKELDSVRKILIVLYIYMIISILTYIHILININRYN